MRRAVDHLVLSLSVVVFCGPVFWLLWHGLAPDRLGANLEVLYRTFAAGGGPTLGQVVGTSALVAAGTALLATAASFAAAYALVFCQARLAALWFWATVATLYFPIEARMLQTFGVTAALGLTSSFAGLILPILPLALGTLFFRQNFKRLPREVIEAARLDGAGPVRCLLHIVLPMSWGAVGAMGLIAFIWGWNQYLWPLMASVDDRHWTLVRGLERLGIASGAGLTLAALSLLPPLVLAAGFARMLGHLGDTRVDA
jgi:sn-glycerol 3-phosphate transport system permease protein